MKIVNKVKLFLDRWKINALEDYQLNMEIGPMEQDFLDFINDKRVTKQFKMPIRKLVNKVECCGNCRYLSEELTDAPCFYECTYRRGEDVKTTIVHQDNFCSGYDPLDGKKRKPNYLNEAYTKYLKHAQEMEEK